MVLLPDSEEFRRQGLALAQNVYTGEVQTVRRQFAGELTTEQQLANFGKDGWQYLPGRLAPPALRRLEGAEAARLAAIQNEIDALSKQVCGRIRDDYERALRFIMQKWNQEPNEFLEKYEARLGFVVDEAERRERETARAGILGGLQVVMPGEARIRELTRGLLDIARDWRARYEADRAKAEIDAKKNDYRLQAEAQDEYRRRLRELEARK